MPIERIEVFDDAARFLAGVAQAGQLAEDHAVFRRALAGGVLASDEGGNGLFQVVHALQYTRHEEAEQ